MSSLPVRQTQNVAVSSEAVEPVPCNIILPGREILVPPSAHTLAGFRAWAKSDEFPERGRISFIDQEIIIDMSPEELETHNKVKVEIGYTLVRVNKKRKLGEFYGDATLLTNVVANLSTEPDATFIRWETFEAKRVRLIPREGEEGQYLEVEGTPDWVLEIVSDSSVRKDNRRLRAQYHRAGIPEYWLIDARGADIAFHILVRGASDYEERVGRGGWQTSRVFSRRFRLVRRRGRLGFWEYTLQVKPLR
jgi:Uma2 family endonuclease